MTKWNTPEHPLKSLKNFNEVIKESLASDEPAIIVLSPNEYEQWKKLGLIGSDIKKLKEEIKSRDAAYRLLERLHHMNIKKLREANIEPAKITDSDFRLDDYGN